jgi:hypothetical protein
LRHRKQPLNVFRSENTRFILYGQLVRLLMNLSDNAAEWRPAIFNYFHPLGHLEALWCFCLEKGDGKNKEKEMGADERRIVGKERWRRNMTEPKQTC